MDVIMTSFNVKEEATMEPSAILGLHFELIEWFQFSL